MIDTAKARRAHEAALRALTMYEFALRELGVQVDAAVSRPAEAPGEAPVSGKAIIHPFRCVVASWRPAPDPMVAKSCEECGAGYEVDARGAHRARYCSDACRQRACYVRTSEAEQERAATAAIVEQNSREGYGNLNWGSKANGQA